MQNVYEILQYHSKKNSFAQQQQKDARKNESEKDKEENKRKR